MRLENGQPGPGPPDRPGAQGFGRPTAGPAGHHARRPGDDQPARSVPDRLDQRRHPGPLHAAVLPARQLRSRPARAGRPPAAAPAVRVLGARREPDRRRSAAVAPVPDAGRAFGTSGPGWSGSRGRTPAWSTSSGKRWRARARSAPAIWRSRRCATAATGAGTGPRQDGAGVAVLLRRGRPRHTATPSSSGSTTSRSGCCRGRSWPRRRPIRRSRSVGLVRRAARALGRGQRVLPARLLPHPPGDDPRRDRRAGGDRGADSGHGPGLGDQDRTTSGTRPAAAHGSRPERCSARSTR